VALVERARRTRTPIRSAFVQRRRAPGIDATGGPLATFVRNGDETGLDLYLSILALISSPANGGYDTTQPSQFWGRVLGLPMSDSMGPQVSKVLRRLRDRKLITTSRDGRLTKVHLVLEDGSGRDYTRPGVQNRDPFLQIPNVYWTDPAHWYRTLVLVEKAVLLIALTLRPTFELNIERGARWYGISPDSLGAGLNGLQSRGVLNVDVTFKEAPFTAVGYTEVRHYRLLPPFSRPTKKAATEVPGAD